MLSVALIYNFVGCLIYSKCHTFTHFHNAWPLGVYVTQLVAYLIK